MSFTCVLGSRRRSLQTFVVHALAIGGLAASLAGCKHAQEVVEAPAPPNDYRLRHPISIREGSRTVELFVGSARGGLTPSQRADVSAFALQWKREATGGVVIGAPVGTPNQYAVRDALPEVRAILVASGVPVQAIAVRPERRSDPGKLGTVRLIYPKMVATAGPCGLWPDDLGTSPGRTYFENRPYYNLGCTTQRNMAAMVENPADLVQPRGETPVLASRRTTVLEKYRKGESTATVYPNANDGKISDVGK